MHIFIVKFYAEAFEADSGINRCVHGCTGIVYGVFVAILTVNRLEVSDVRKHVKKNCFFHIGGHHITV